MITALQVISGVTEFSAFALIMLAAALLLGLLLCIGITVFAGRLMNKRMREEEEDDRDSK